MRTIAFFVVCFFGCSTQMEAQSLNAYQYVQVPEKYEFQDEKNEYLLNGLTAFLFEKYGFNVLYQEKIPEGTDPCKILKADVLNESNLFRTKVKVTLKDCYNNIVFASEVGKSRFKDYKRSFHDALRNAFVSIENLDYTYESAPEEQGKLGFQIKTVPEPAKPEKAKNNEIIENNGNASKLKNKAPITESGESSIKFINGNIEYQLKKTASGYDLFKNGNKQKFATLMKSAGGKNFIYASENVHGIAYFDDLRNLVVEYISPKTGQLITLKYKVKD